MEIEEPPQQKKPMTQVGRRVDNAMLAEGKAGEKKMAGGKGSSKASVKDLHGTFKGKELKNEGGKQPLNARNVPRPKID